MFATTEPEKVLPTILSRCQRFDLRRIPVPLIVEHLPQIARQENVQIDDAALHAIARGAEGGMRDAESALDQLISFCGDKIVEKDVLSMFGLTAQGQILSLAGAILSGEPQTILRDLNDLTQHGKDLGRLLSDLLHHFRNILIYQVSKGDTNLLESSEAGLAVLKDHAARVGTDALTRIMEVLSDCETRLRDAASKKIFLEIALLKAAQMREAVDINALLNQLNDLRPDAGPTPTAAAPATSQAASPAPSKPAASSARRTRTATIEPPPDSASMPAPAPAAAAASPGSPTELSGLWQQLVEAAGKVSPFARSYLLEAHPVAFNGKLFTIGFDPEFSDHISLVDTARNHALLQTKLQELGHPQVQFKFIQAESPLPKASPAPAAAAEPAATVSAAPPAPAPARAEPTAAKTANVSLSVEDFKNDPLIKKALEIFKGQIVEIRA